MLYLLERIRLDLRRKKTSLISIRIVIYKLYNIDVIV